MTHSRIVLLLLMVAVTSAVALNPASSEAGQASNKALQTHSDDQQHEEAFFERCPQGSDWVKFRGYCYKYFEEAKYWVPAEEACNAAAPGAHLVSISNATENAFVGKLTYCKTAWTGRYAIHVDRLTDPSNYRWSDRSTINSQYHAHNFTGLNSIHFPLIAASDLKWYNYVYHAKNPYVCKVSAPQRNYTCDCPTGWKQLDNNCYLMPKFTATYIEGDFYCRGRDAYMVSLHNERELRAMSLLDVDSITCPVETWIGLIKLNPCRIDFSTGARICYRWSDRSGDYADFPKWMAGSPNPDMVTNCVALKDREIKTIPCHTRAQFVCKKKVSPIVHTRQCTI